MGLITRRKPAEFISVATDRGATQYGAKPISRGFDVAFAVLLTRHKLAHG
jgi:hypothetical protein